ncbi:MAG: hypothetical protein HY609_01710 [Deltaproteobacteria bacterium]|nr:hypothetical protein [Deltaproteobacteria bacterium]
MKKLLAWGGMGIAGLLLATQAWSVQYTKSADKMTIVVDQAFEFHKPDKKWDTQKVRKDPNTPLKWVFKQAGPDPVITLKYLDLAKGKNLSKIANHLKMEYKLQGINIEKVEQKTINGSRALLLHGQKPSKNERLLIGVLVGPSQGYILECASEADDFNAIKGHFRQAINTARILK